MEHAMEEYAFGSGKGILHKKKDVSQTDNNTDALEKPDYSDTGDLWDWME